MKEKKPIVLDAWAVMAYLQGEPAAKNVADIISDALEQGVPVGMCVVNVGEVWYTVARRRSASDAQEVLRLLREIGIKMVDADFALTGIAAGFKVRGGISYADCFAAALAKQKGGTLVTGDPEFKQLENEIAIEWL